MMEHLDNLGDKRGLQWCVHCGGRIESRDHTPSKVLLDAPYPPNLPVALACKSCNEGFSSDEEYVACLIECTLAGTTETEKLERQTVKRILRRKPALAARLSAARTQDKEGIAFTVEHDRVHNVLRKLARGHAAYELNQILTCDPDQIMAYPITLLDENQRSAFEQAPDLWFFPEVGSRGMQRMLVDLENMRARSPWVAVQEGRYRFLTVRSSDYIMIRIVLSEYLVSEILWLED